jgi:hypothetical protein
LSDIQSNNVLQNARAEIQRGESTAPSLHLNFEEQASDHAFYGAGSHQTKAGEEQIASFTSPFERDTQMVFSAWTYVDPGKWNSGFWLLSVRDANGTELQVEKIETRNSNDIQGTWIRSEAKILLPKGAHLQISSFGEKEMIVDELMLWPLGASPIVRNPGAAEVLYQNFKIK